MNLKYVKWIITDKVEMPYKKIIRLRFTFSFVYSKNSIIQKKIKIVTVINGSNIKILYGIFSAIKAIILLIICIAERLELIWFQSF